MQRPPEPPSLDPDPLLSPQVLLKRLRWRYAVKRFDPQKDVLPQQWQALEQTLVLTPSSFGLQPWRFFVLREKPLREQLVAACWNQRQVVDAAYLVVLAVKREFTPADVDRFVHRTAQVRQVPVETLGGFRDVMHAFVASPPEGLTLAEWATRQLYIALGNLMTAAALLGVDTCPMEGFVPPQVDRILGLGDLGYRSVLLCPVGHRASDDKYATAPKVRYPHEDVIVHLGNAIER